jgi:hypothetical protein
MSTALTNRAKSGEAAKDTASFTEMVDKHNQADTTRTFGKKTTIKINTDPAKGK